MHIVDQIKENAKKDPRWIVFPESSDERILQASVKTIEEKIAKIILLGNKQKILEDAQKLNLDISKNNEWLKIVDPNNSPEKIEGYAKAFYELRKHKGISEEDARDTVVKDTYFGTMMVHQGEADGFISGAIHTTGETILPGMQIVKTKEGIKRVSGLFLMVLDNHVLIFADSAVNIEPTSEEIAEIAYLSAQTAKSFGIDPKVAFLSFSTKGSAKHEKAFHTQEAVEIFKRNHPSIIADGELQVDAAIVPEVAKLKAPNSKIQGDANVLIFPDLQSGNIAYKLVERLAGANAIGPIIQGFKKPINDLSRGCRVDEIVDMTAITVVQAQNGDLKE